MLNSLKRNRYGRRPWLPLAWWGICLVTGLALGETKASSAGPATADATTGGPGYLVIEAARDSSAGFRWESGPGPGYRSLVWDQGRLVIPDSLSCDHFGKHDLGISFTENFAGSGVSGRIVLVDGIFPVSEPVVLSDGFLELELSAGELEIRGSRIRYRRASLQPRDFRSGLLMLAGMTLLVIVLLRRARLKASERTGA